MLSRRNIRIKVMQMLYGSSRDTDLSYLDVLGRFRRNIDQSYSLYLFNLYYLTQVAKYALEDAAKRSSKHLPTPEDKAFTGKLFENDAVQSLISNEAFGQLIDRKKFAEQIDRDVVRRLYKEFAKGEAYKAFLANPADSNPDHIAIILALYKHCVSDETFNEIMEDQYSSWIDDKSLIVGSIKKTIKALPAPDDFCDRYRPDDETVESFGTALLSKVFKEDKELLAVIEPTLKNWDADRVATIDMILLKMALSELLIFPTIPTKVTLNEFVEISKRYSTEKSKDFINGILDRLMKQLNKDGKIKKEGRGLMD